MNDNSFFVHPPKANVVKSKLDIAMQPYIDSGQYSEQQLAEIRKRLSNQMKNEEERKDKRL